MMNNKSNVFNICVMGAAKVGKTSIVQRLIGNPFLEEHKVAVGFDYYRKYISVDGNQMLLSIQDLSGSDEFPAMEKQAIEKADIVIVVFSLSDFESCRHAVNICQDLENRKVSAPVIVVGNKADCFLGNLENKSAIADIIMCSLNRSYLDMSAKYDDVGKLLRVIYEEKEIARGPYRILKVKPTKLKKFLSKSLSFTKLFSNQDNVKIV